MREGTYSSIQLVQIALAYNCALVVVEVNFENLATENSMHVDQAKIGSGPTLLNLVGWN